MTSPGAVSSMEGTARGIPVDPQRPRGLAQLTTPGSDGVEQGVFTSEFLGTQVTSFILAVFAVLTAVGLGNPTPDQKKAVIDLAVAVIGAMQVAYSIGRSIRKGLAAPKVGR